MSEHEPSDVRETEMPEDEDVEAHLSKGTIGAGVAAVALFAAAPAQSKPAPIEGGDPVTITADRTVSQNAAKPQAKKAKKTAVAKKAAAPVKAPDFSKKPLADPGP